MLKIEVTLDTPDALTVSLTGAISADHLPELGRLFDEARERGQRVRLGLEATTLVAREAVTFLAVGRGSGAELERCPSFLREWIRREADSSAVHGLDDDGLGRGARMTDRIRESSRS